MWFEKIKKNRGFTLAETLLVVGILGVLAAVAFFAIVPAAKNAKLTGLDTQAKAIYVSAQNQLLQSEASGEWAVIYDEAVESGDFSGFGTSMKNLKPSDYEYWAADTDNTWPEDCEDMYYFTDKDTATEDIKELLVTNLSITEDVDLSGHFIIEYNIKTATIYGVFYSENELDYASDITNNLNNGGRESESVTSGEARDLRKEVMIGYYGGGLTTDLDDAGLVEPEVKVKNGEELQIIVKDKNCGSSSTESLTRTTAYMIVKGVQSGAEDKFLLYHSGNSDFKLINVDTNEIIYCVTENLDPTYIEYTIVLDSITALTKSGSNVNEHFSGICPSLTPGEDIKVEIELMPGSSTVSLPAKKSVLTNSLFDGISEEGVSITTMRHFENLSEEISGCTLSAIGSSDTTKWDTAIFLNSISFDNTGASDISDTITKDYNSYSITNESGAVISRYSEHSYVPVVIDGDLTVEGNGYNVYDIHTSDGTSPSSVTAIGLFGTVDGDLTVNDLGVVSMPSRTEAKTKFSSSNAAYAGLICGYVTGDTVFTNTYAAGSITLSALQDTAYAGGLLGKCDGTVIIDSCYMSALTKDGGYEIDEANANISALSTNESKAYIGGLIGYCEITANIDGSYSLASLGFGEKAVAGGLIGHTATAIISDSYAYAPQISSEALTSAQNATIKRGGITGEVTTWNTSNDAKYLGAFTGFSDAEITDDHGTGVLFSDTQTGFVKVSEIYPYDEDLAETEYIFEDVTGLGHHYGDWSEALYEVPRYYATDLIKTYNTIVQAPTDHNYNPFVMEKTGDSYATDAGTYSYRVSIIDKNMFCWAQWSGAYPDGMDSSQWSGLASDNQADIVVSWRIDPKPLAIPTQTNTGLVYNTLKQYLEWEPEYLTGEVITGGDLFATNATQSEPYTATFDLSSTRNYVWSDGTTTQKTIDWTIEKYDLANATIEEIGTLYYTGYNITPTPKVTAPIPSGKETTLVEGTDFTYSYTNNLGNEDEVTATVTITAVSTSNYKNTNSLDFKIKNNRVKVVFHSEAGGYFKKD